MSQFFILSATMSLTLSSSAPSLLSPVSVSHSRSVSPAITIIDAAPCRQRRTPASASASLSLAQRRELQDQMRAEKAKTSMFFSAISSLDVGRVERLLHEPNFCTTAVANRAISLLNDLFFFFVLSSNDIYTSPTPSSVADEERINTILQLLSNATSRVAV